MAATADDTPELIDDRDAAALTEKMTVLPDIGRARFAEDMFVVSSASGHDYLVDLREARCECDDAFYRDPEGGCKHVRRAQFADGRRDIPNWTDQSAIDPLLGRHCDTED